MDDDFDDDDRVGVPRAGAAGVRDVPRAGAVVEPGEPELRDGETGLGRPPQVPAGAAPLTDDDRRRLRLAAESQALADLAEAEELLAADPAIGWAGWLAGPLAGAFLVGSAGALGLLLVSQALAVSANLAAQPAAIQYTGYGLVGLLGGAVVYAAGRLVAAYVTLRRNRQVRLAGLLALQARTRLRWLAAAKTDEARVRLAEYLTAYPVGTPADARRLGRLGLAAADVARLAAVRAELADAARFGSSVDWFGRFRAGFQAPLDDAADARVRHWANRAMLVTAASPNGLVDSLATVYFGFAMLRDLCAVYHVRAGRAGTAVLLGRVFFNAYLAGSLNDVEGLIEGQADHVFEQAFTTLGVGVGSGVAGKFLGKVGAKATTGYLNRLLLLRLGKYACRLLRPVAA